MMRNIQKKLNSSRGASMIIAMVFMLMCVFVGGSVLTAATSNAYRIAHLSDQQDYLSQRSAAMLVADELKYEDGSRMRLTVHDNIKHVQPVRVLPSGVVVDNGTPYDVHMVKFSLPAGRELTALQRTAYETAIWNYMKYHKISVDASGLAFREVGGTQQLVDIEVENFVYLKSDGTTENVNFGNFWTKFTWSPWSPESSPIEDAPIISGKFHVTGTQINPGDLTDFDATFGYPNFQNWKDSFDYMVSFDTMGQLKVLLNAAPSSTVLPVVTQITQDNKKIENPEHAADPTKPQYTYKKVDSRVTTETTMTVISWDPPMISKGAAE